VVDGHHALLSVVGVYKHIILKASQQPGIQLRDAVNAAAINHSFGELLSHSTQSRHYPGQVSVRNQRATACQLNEDVASVWWIRLHLAILQMQCLLNVVVDRRSSRGRQRQTRTLKNAAHCSDSPVVRSETLAPT